MTDAFMCIHLILTISLWGYELFPCYRFKNLKCEWLVHDHLSYPWPNQDSNSDLFEFKVVPVLWQRPKIRMDGGGGLIRGKASWLPGGLCLKCSLIGQRLSVGSWALGLNAKAYERKPSSRYIKFLSLHYFFNSFSLLPVKSPASRCMKAPTKKLLSLPPLSPSNPLPGSNLRAALSPVCSQRITEDIQYNG